MAKKPDVKGADVQEAAGAALEAGTVGDGGGPLDTSLPEGNGEEGMSFETDFNVEEEFKPEPLIPNATYHGAVTKVVYSPGTSTIDWTVTLHDNGGLMSDGETPVDGATIIYKNWLPKAGNEHEMTKNGRSTKRQSKINMLKQFAEDMKIGMGTPEIIRNSLLDQLWLGIEVDVVVSSRTWEGKIFNDVKKMKARA
jgi:hypothetical protein